MAVLGSMTCLISISSWRMDFPTTPRCITNALGRFSLSASSLAICPFGLLFWKTKVGRNWFLMYGHVSFYSEDQWS
jgi:hypothetical protein